MSKTVKNLFSKMTIDEKIGQLIQVTGDFFQNDDSEITGPLSQTNRLKEDARYNVGSVLGISGADDVAKIQKDFLDHNRLKIPLLFMADIVHGYKTIFPIPLGIASTFNPDMMTISSEVAASESAAGGIRVTFAPMTDLVRDPRWGRVMESTGEDPHLNSVMASASVKGFQGELPIDNNHVAATVKHFAGYGMPEAGREYNTVDISEWRFRDQYLSSYKAAIDAQAKLVMTSFNTLFGVPATGNKYLMKDILRDELSFDGVLISDWNAIEELIHHGTAADLNNAAEIALNAGVDIDMMAFAYSKLLDDIDGIPDKILKLIDESVIRILELKEDLGLFKDPYIGISQQKEMDAGVANKNRQQALRVAEESVVLVKNSNNTLPLSTSQRVFLTGPKANTGDLLGSWSWKGDIDATDSLFTQLKQKMDTVNFAEGINYRQDSSNEWDNIVDQVKDVDVIVVALGLQSSESGEATSMTNPALPEEQVTYLQKLHLLGKPVVTIVITGRPLILRTVNELSDSVLISFFPGTMGAKALSNILVGDTEPTGRLPMTFPRSTGQIPIYYNAYNTGRPAEIGVQNGESKYISKYIDSPNEPLYPFGFGLGYADIDIVDVTMINHVVSMSGTIELTVKLVNVSNNAGSTVLQCYTHQKVGDTVRPLKELKWFKKVYLLANSSKEIKISLAVQNLASVHSDLKSSVDEGYYDVMVGLNSLEMKHDNVQIKYLEEK